MLQEEALYSEVLKSAPVENPVKYISMLNGILNAAQDIMKVTLPSVASAPSDESAVGSSGRLERWSPGRDSFAQEAIFVPRTGKGNSNNDKGNDADENGNEDEGWLLAPVFRSASMTTDLVILDAADVAAGPVATIHLPHHIPIGKSPKTLHDSNGILYL